MHAGGATESRVAGAHLHVPVRPIGRPAILIGVALLTGAVFIAIGVALLMIGGMGGSEDETVGAVRWRETGDDGRWWEEGDGDVRQEMGDGSWGSRWWWLDRHVMWASHGLQKSMRSAMLIHHAWRWVVQVSSRLVELRTGDEQ